jgi:hypothetical protein
MRVRPVYGFPSAEAIGVDVGPTVWHGNEEGMRLGVWLDGRYLPSRNFPYGILGFEGGLSYGTGNGSVAYRAGAWKRWGLLGARSRVRGLVTRDAGLFAPRSAPRTRSWPPRGDILTVPGLCPSSIAIGRARARGSAVLVPRAHDRGNRLPGDRNDRPPAPRRVAPRVPEGLGRVPRGGRSRSGRELRVGSVHRRGVAAGGFLECRATRRAGFRVPARAARAAARHRRGEPDGGHVLLLRERSRPAA